MPAKKTQTESVPANKNAKAGVSSKKTLVLGESKNPKSLDRLFIPGATRDIQGYDAGIPAWLIEYDLRVSVHKNWEAAEGDVIHVGYLKGPGELASLARATLSKEDAENESTYYFSLKKADLPDGTYPLVYAVYFKGGHDYQISTALVTAIKTDLPAGPHNGPEEGHPKIKFELSEKKITPANIARGVDITVQPYPNMHALDKIHIRWSSLEIIKPIAGVEQITTIKITHADIVEGGDDLSLGVYLMLVDFVGNVSTPGSATVTVSVDTDESKVDGPAMLTNDPEGLIDLERLNGEPLDLECYTSDEVGFIDDLYDITVRSYPKLGGVVVHRGFEKITRAGRPVIHQVPHSIVRAAIEGRMVASFVLRKTAEPYEVYSRQTSAKVVGQVIYIDPPFFEKYEGHVVDPIPSSLVFVCPWYEWRKPTDELTIVILHVKPNQEVIMYSDERVVGTTWPANSPVKRLVEKADLEKFAGLTAQIYFVYRSKQTKASSPNINESRRQDIRFGK
ncbi:hypothetical protein ACI77M_14180 [Pseudomonas fildesensis]|uniref:hypothetical protein n=1 Tax=Pseudomonas fildesensis TaxID=1674920 RepID=UPI00387B50AE